MPLLTLCKYPPNMGPRCLRKAAPSRGLIGSTEMITHVLFPTHSTNTPGSCHSAPGGTKPPGPLREDGFPHATQEQADWLS